MVDETNVKLKPCPFCGSRNIKYEFTSSSGFYICLDCCCEGPIADDACDPICSIDAATEIWNKRADK